MKLIDLLVQELPKRGGWPDGVKRIEQNFHGKLFDGSEPKEPYLFAGKKFEMVDEWRTSRITREQYEAALAAAQQPVWNGEGLPPVGCECEVSVCGGWEPGRIVFSDESIGVAYVCESSLSPTLDCVSGFSALKHFRPIRSEREEAINQIAELMGRGTFYADATSVYDAIARGDIPGVKLSD